MIQHGTKTVGFYSFTKGAVELIRVEVVSSHLACERYLREDDPEVPEELFLTNLIREVVPRLPFMVGGHWMIDAGRPMFRELPFVQIATVESHQTGVRYLVLLLPEEWSPALFVKQQ